MANWIQKAIKNPGALRRTAKVKGDKTISVKKLNQLAKSKNPTTRRRAILAKTLRSFHKKAK